MGIRIVLALVFVSTTLTACGSGRDPGPHPEEFGLVTFWRVIGGDVEIENCTDAQDWSTIAQPPPAGENYFLTYRLSEDGSQAVDQQCSTTDALTCQNSSFGQIFYAQGHSLVTQPELSYSETLSSTCTLRGETTWTIHDQGTIGTFIMALEFEYTHEASCQPYEDQFISESTNEQGYKDCSVRMIADLEYFTSN